MGDVHISCFTFTFYLLLSGDALQEKLGLTKALYNPISFLVLAVLKIKRKQRCYCWLLSPDASSFPPGFFLLSISVASLSLCCFVSVAAASPLCCCYCCCFLFCAALLLLTSAGPLPLLKSSYLSIFYSLLTSAAVH